MTENIDFQQASFCLFSRDLVLLRCGSWSKKIEVAKSSKGEEISVNLISSEFGKPWKYLFYFTQKCIHSLYRYPVYHLLYIMEGRVVTIPEFKTLQY